MKLKKKKTNFVCTANEITHRTHPIMNNFVCVSCILCDVIAIAAAELSKRYLIIQMIVV